LSPRIARDRDIPAGRTNGRQSKKRREDDMKIAFRMLLVMPLLAGPLAAAAIADEAANEALARRFYTEFNAGNVSAFDDFIAADFIDHTPTVPDAPQGLEGVKHEIQGYLAAFPDARIVNDRVIAKDDYVTVISTLTGTNTGMLLGMAATGKPVKINAIDVWLVRDGKLAEVWHVEQLLQMMMQLGAMGGGK
jgi:steroid delta-isomerase-like uncharacterized protein